MKTRTNKALCVGALAAASLALTACSATAATGTGTSKPSAAPVSASAALDATVGKLAEVSYHVKVTGDGETGTGTVEPGSKAAALDMSTPIGHGTTLHMDTLAIGGQVYLKIDAGAAVDASMHVNPHEWMRLSAAKLTSGVAMPLDAADATDPLDIDGLLQAVSAVHRTDATHYAGTMDLTNSGGVLSSDSDDLTKAGSAAKAVPFTAVLDAQGRLLELTITAPKAAKDLSITVTLSDYGTATAVTTPAASAITSTPSGVYAMLNG